MDDLRSLREQRDELRSQLDAIMERNDSIDDIESIEALEKGTARMAELDASIRSAEAKARYNEMREAAAPSYSFRSETTTRKNDGEYRFEVLPNNEVRVVGGGSAGSDATFTGDYGASIPVDLQAEMIRRLPVLAPIRGFFGSTQYQNDVELQRVASRIAMTTSASTAGGNVTAESAAYTEEDFVLERVRSRNFKTAAKSRVTEEFMRDARGRAVAEMLLQHAEEHGRLWDELYALGLGADAGPEPVLLTPTALAAASGDFANAAATPHAEINLQGFDNSDWAAASNAVKSELMVEYLTNLRYGQIPAQYWGGLKWLVTQEFFALLAGLTDGFGRPLFQPLNLSSPEASTAAGTLLGLPVTVTNNQTGTAGDSAQTVLAVLAHSEDYRIFDRTPYSQQVDPYSRGDNGEVVYRTRMRSDGRWLRPYAAGMLHTVA